MKAVTDKMMDIAIAKMLRFGVILSAALVFFGGILYLRHPLLPAPGYSHFRGETTTFLGIAGVLRGAGRLDARSVIQLGILFLIATPVVRVAFCMVGFARQKDRLYVIISSSVLAILIYSLIRGGR